jgi:hypothetical protein
VNHLISGASLWFMYEWPIDGEPIPVDGVMAIMSMIMFVTTFMFMSCIALRKFPLVLGALFLHLYAFVNILMFGALVYLTNGNQFSFNYGGGMLRSNELMDTLIFLSKNFTWFLGLASVVVLYVSFLKLKEKQIR